MNTGELMSGHREKPDNMKDMTNQLWYAIIGTNGEGLLGRTDRIEKKIDEHLKAGASKKQPKRLEVLTIILAVAISLQTLGLLDGIRAVIYQALTGERLQSIEVNVEDGSER